MRRETAEACAKRLPPRFVGHHNVATLHFTMQNCNRNVFKLRALGIRMWHGARNLQGKTKPECHRQSWGNHSHTSALSTGADCASRRQLDTRWRGEPDADDCCYVLSPRTVDSALPVSASGCPDWRSSRTPPPPSLPSIVRSLSSFVSSRFTRLGC